jgi:steroid delta-isomerase-like uncharacterized protein
MSTEENKALDRRLHEEVYNQGHLALIDELCVPNAVAYHPAMTLHGTEDFKQFAAMYRTAFPDLHYTIEDQIAEGDKVVTRWAARGTHAGEFQGFPPTGKQGSMTGIIIARFVSGKFVESWSNYDALGLLQQLGVVPSAGQTGSGAV